MAIDEDSHLEDKEDKFGMDLLFLGGSVGVGAAAVRH
jgi:hypothetical protein